MQNERERQKRKFKIYLYLKSQSTTTQDPMNAENKPQKKTVRKKRRKYSIGINSKINNVLVSEFHKGIKEGFNHKLNYEDFVIKFLEYKLIKNK